MTLQSNIRFKRYLHTHLHSYMWCLQINPILGNSCPSTTATIKIVDECPKTEQAWKDAAARKGCHMLAATQYCSKFQYHCLVNQWQNATLEVCAPIWYISGNSNVCYSFVNDSYIYIVFMKCLLFFYLGFLKLVIRVWW